MIESSRRKANHFNHTKEEEFQFPGCLAALDAGWNRDWADQFAV
jgi:hypothetical protein